MASEVNLSKCGVCGEQFGQWAHLPINGSVEWTEMYRVDSVCVDREAGEVGRIYAHGERL